LFVFFIQEEHPKAPKEFDIWMRQNYGWNPEEIPSSLSFKPAKPPNKNGFLGFRQGT
jgi:hypothetical protein